jgi:hypothetical protein
MKGLVFTEFLEMVELYYGYDLVDELIEESDLASGGAYTAVGTYDHQEMVQLVTGLSQKVEKETTELLKIYGLYFFDTLKTSYGHFFERCNSLFEFLESIHGHIHVEVYKLYPDAELPAFKTARIDEDTLEMIYSSKRKMSGFAEGLMERSADHFQEECTITKEILTDDGTEVRFTIRKNS